MKPIGYRAFAVMSILLAAFSSIAFAVEKEGIKQETHGDQSATIAGADTVTIIYQGLSEEERGLLFSQLGNSQQIITLLVKELEKKDKKLIANEKELDIRKAEIKNWVKKYNELKTKYYELSKTNELPQNKLDEVKEAIIEGDLKKAKSGTTLRGVSRHGVSRLSSP